MHKLTVCLTIAMLGLFQQALARGKHPLAVPLLDKGLVEGKTYNNASVGLELTPDSTLTFLTPDLIENGTARLYLMLSPWENPSRDRARLLVRLPWLPIPKGSDRLKLA